MATTDTQLQQLVINVGTEDQIAAGIASGTITEDMLSIATDGADITYDWIGTLAEYNTQNIATLHPDWLCFITDDVNNSGEDVYENVYSKTEANETFVAKNEAPAYLPCLLEFKWSDHILNNVSWLRADTFSWQSGEIYEGVYDHLVADIEGKALQSETIEDITISYYLADDKHKICPASEESKLISLYDTTGVAWYYIIDTANQRFKLPRTKYGFTGIRSGVGGYVPESLPNIKGVGTIQQTVGTPTGSFYKAASANGGTTYSTATDRTLLGFDASLYSSTYQDNAPVQQRATQMYLYFYAGEFSQDAIVNTAGITTEVLNNKADVSLSNTLANIDFVIESQLPTADNDYTWYRKYKSGWVEQGGKITVGEGPTTTTHTMNLPVEMADTNYNLIVEGITGDTSSNTIGVQYGNAYYGAVWNSGKSTTSFNYRAPIGGCWEVKGIAAA